jgi:ribosomal-protein-alanine N-acetyltransferase
VEQVYDIMVEGILRSVIVSDEEKVLLEAKAAKKAVLGLYDEENLQAAPSGVPYLAERNTLLSEEYLERIIRRQAGLPWNITETKRLLIRELIPEDWGFLDDWTKEHFSGYEGFQAYIKNQYPFYEYGIWAVIEKESNLPTGACGIWNPKKEDLPEPEAMEIGYGIHPDFRRKGYGKEAVEGVIQYYLENFTNPLYARIWEENLPSRLLAVKCGFTALPAQSGTRILQYRYGQNWK